MPKGKAQDVPVPPQEENAEKAKLILQQERMGRANRCRAEIDAILQKHKCRLDVMVVLRAGQVIPQLDVVPLE